MRTVIKATACTVAIGAIALGVAGCGGMAKLTGITPGSPAATGESIFQSAGCTSCHMIKGQGGADAPDLTVVGSLGKTATYSGTLPIPVPGVTGPVYSGKSWFVLHTECPSCATPGSAMPAFRNFTPQQYLALATFLNGLGVTEK